MDNRTIPASYLAFLTSRAHGYQSGHTDFVAGYDMPLDIHDTRQSLDLFIRLAADKKASLGIRLALVFLSLM